MKNELGGYTNGCSDTEAKWYYSEYYPVMREVTCVNKNGS